MEETAVANRVGVLLVHGLGGTQYDLGSLHKILKKAGVDTHTLTLPGHGTQPEDLLDVVAEDWLAAVEAQYHELAAQYETLHVMGMCLGSLIAVEVVKRVGHTKGKLIALAPPVFLDGWSTPWYRGLRYLVYKLPSLARKMKVVEEDPFGIKNDLVRAIVKAKFERGDNFHYAWVPLACIRQVDRLRSWVVQGLSAITCPTLVIHAREDELTSPRSAEFLVKEIGADHAQMIIVENSYHMICVDNDRDQVAIEVLRHLELDTSVVKVRERRRG
ncbi:MULTISPECIES: alpha/beta hydrolase [Silvimonas]|uniref:alpha/beta hydrolase n=1 Tax=Silvimonas TaxID=300264 RepID=UPI0024B3A08B|nr:MULTISPECIES: alpha/beta fold hydrolase [Silvimonas]MDR3426150.1 alpha/beta fold hydrolase [Silvimonas sp.]